MTRSQLFNLLKFLVAVALLVWLFLKLPDPSALWQQIVTANKYLLLLGAICYATAVAVSGLKWGVLLRASGIAVPTGRLLSYQWMAEFFNNFLPAQVGGDVMRGYAVAADTRRTADATASVVIDRKILADLALTDEVAFKAIVEQVKSALDGKKFVAKL